MSESSFSWYSFAWIDFKHLKQEILRCLRHISQVLLRNTCVAQLIFDEYLFVIFPVEQISACEQVKEDWANAKNVAFLTASFFP